jgi:hypothetical protein
VGGVKLASKKRSLAKVVKTIQKTLLLTTVAILVFFSCSKENSTLVTKQPTKATPKPTNAQTHSYVNTAAIGLLELSKDINFRSLVYAEVAKQFDDDDNVLLNKLDRSLNNNMAAELQNSISFHAINSLKTVSHFQTGYFTDIDHIVKCVKGIPFGTDTAYLQIFVPSIELVDKTKQPVIVPVFQETSNDKYIGYRFNASGGLDTITITEDFAKTNPVWAISYNETVNSSGQLPQAALTSVDGAQDRAVANDVRITEINVTDFKESWINGKAEISWVAVHMDNCVASHSLNGFGMKKLKKKYNGEWVSVKNGLHTYMAASNSGFGCLQGSLINFIFYEKDKSVESNGQAPKSFWCDNISLSFYSDQTPYGNDYFFWSPIVQDWKQTQPFVLTGMKIRAERGGF